MAPIGNPPANDDIDTTAFIDLIDSAMQERAKLVATQTYALNMGIDPDDLRRYVAGRDGLLLSNTWGDRSRDAKIRFSEFVFCFKLVDCVDIVIID